MLHPGNVSAMADELVTTAALARAAGLKADTDPQSGAIELVNVTNDQYFAQLVVTALNQANIPSEAQAAVFIQALARSLTASGETSEAPDIIITAAVAANQVGSIAPGFAQVGCMGLSMHQWSICMACLYCCLAINGQAGRGVAYSVGY